MALACASPEPVKTAGSDSAPSAVIETSSPAADSGRAVVASLTLIAFYPSSPPADTDEELSTVLDDFSQHLSAARDSLRAMGFRIETQAVDSARVVQDTLGLTFQLPRDSADIGYYFAAPGRPPMIIYGVRTNTQIVQAAREFLPRTP